MVRGRIKRGERRIDAAIDHLAAYGFPKPRIRKVVNDLLQIYGRDGWVFLEEGQYRVVLDTLLEQQEQDEPPQDQQPKAAAAEEAPPGNDMQVPPENHMQLSGEQNLEQINEAQSPLKAQASHDTAPSLEPVTALPEPELEAAAAEEGSPENHMQLSGEQSVESISGSSTSIEPVRLLQPQAPHNPLPSFQPAIPPGFKKKPVMPLSGVGNVALRPQASHNHSPSFQPAIPPGFEKEPVMPLSRVQNGRQSQLAIQPQASHNPSPSIQPSFPPGFRNPSPSIQPSFPPGFEKKPAMPLSKAQNVGQARLAFKPQDSHNPSPSIQSSFPPGFGKKPVMPLSRVQNLGQSQLALQPQASHQSSRSFESVMAPPQAEPAVPELPAGCKYPPCCGWISESEESDPENKPKDAEIPPRMPSPKECVPSRRKRPSRWDVRPN